MGPFVLVTAVLEFVMKLVRCYFNCASIVIIVDYVLRGSCKPKEYTVIYMGIAFGRANIRFLNGDRGSKSSHMFEVWFVAAPSFIWRFLYRRMIGLVKEITRIHESIIPKFSSN